MSERTYSEVMDDLRHHIAVDESVATDPEDIFAIEARINKGLADELDAAHKRELDELRKRIGDPAKVREALKKCLLYISCAESVGIGTITLNDKVKLDPKKIIKSAKKALAATEQEGGDDADK